ncbi:MAG: RnfABCDGE type electron transport complex subunit G [Clostridiales bacterium]|jgi:electron transport complex protein RnfG|nr:RnfABCDGE type electron transport complex subunit G [Clostridiales bacterium]
MNETAAKKNSGMSKLVFILFAISVITSLLLGLVNYITEGPIAESKAKKTTEAMFIVMPADEYVTETYTGKDITVQSLSSAMSGGEQTGWVVGVSPSGFGGAIEMVVGVDKNYLVTGISIISMTETSGLGTNANKDEFKNQFIAQGAGLAVNKDGGTIQALTGATVTSRAVTNGVNSAVEAAMEAGGRK